VLDVFVHLGRAAIYSQTLTVKEGRETVNPVDTITFSQILLRLSTELCTAPAEATGDKLPPTVPDPSKRSLVPADERSKEAQVA
jgi:hypothetical protein